MRKLIFLLLMTLSTTLVTAQGFYNHVWLLGNFFFIQDPDKLPIEFYQE